MRTPDRPVLLLPVVIALALLLAGSHALPLLDRDEPRFSRATVEMMQRGDWVVPWFNGGHRFDKPPLTYWLMAVGYGLLGIGELGARLHSILAAAAVAWVLFLMGRRLFSTAVGFAAAFAWSTALQVFIHGRLAVADMPMVLAVTVSCWSLWELLFEPRGPAESRWRWTLWLSLALGFLAKGPIALAVPALTAILARAFLGRRKLPWRRLGAVWGVPVMLAVVGAWGIPALVRTGGAFWDVGIGEHVVRRGVESFNERPVVPFYYLLTVFLSLFPWSPMLGQAVVELRRNWRDDQNRFLLAWILGPFLVFSFYTTQLPHYTMPAFPALLLLMFRRGTDPALFPRASRWLYTGLHGLFGLLFLGLGAALLWLSPEGDLDRVRVAALWLVPVLLGLQSVALRLPAAMRERVPGRPLPRPADLRWVLVSVAVVVFATVQFAGGVRPLTVPIRLDRLYDAMPADTRYGARGYTEPSLVFYADATWDMDPEPDEVRALVDGGDPFLLVYRIGEASLDEALRAPDTLSAGGTSDEELRQAGIPAVLRRRDLERIRIQGLNFARSSWTDLLVVRRR